MTAFSWMYGPLPFHFGTPLWGGGFAMVMVSGWWTNSTLQQQSYSLLTGGGLVPQKAVCRIQPRALDVIQEGERSHGVQNSPSFEFGDLARSSRSQRVMKPPELTNPFARNILNTSTRPPPSLSKQNAAPHSPRTINFRTPREYRHSSSNLPLENRLRVRVRARSVFRTRVIK